MTTISHFLVPDEQIVAVYHTGFRPMRPFFLLTFALAALIDVVHSGNDNDVLPILVIITGMLLILWLSFAVASIAQLRLSSHRYVITDRRVLLDAPRRMEEVALNDVSSANVYTWLLGGGSLVLSRRNGHTFTLYGIDNPSHARQVILEYTRKQT